MKRIFFMVLLLSCVTSFAQTRASLETRRIMQQFATAKSADRQKLLDSQLGCHLAIDRETMKVQALAKVDLSFDAKQLASKGILVNTQVGDIVTLHLSFSQLPLLDNTQGVLYYEIARRLAPLNNQTRFDTRTDSVQQGLDLPQPFNGDDVIIGITDWGFDYTHINFNNRTEDNHRILRAWDHFRTAGPAPQGFNYGTEIVGYDALIEAQCDTSGLYGYATHGSHVAGIAAGRGTSSGNYRGQAPNAKLLMCSFLLNEAAWLDAVAWMKNVAQSEGKRLVINSSWGMYTFSNLDGTSLLSQAINHYSDSGIVFVTSGGNNGDGNSHISKTFSDTLPDTLRTIAAYYPTGIGEALILWGEAGHDFQAAIGIHNGSSLVATQYFNTASSPDWTDSFLVVGADTIRFNLLCEHANFNNGAPHMLFNVDRKSNYQLHLFVTSSTNFVTSSTNHTVHAWNICNLENNAGNMGASFSRNNYGNYTNGDNTHGVGEPGCAAKTITVAAHQADRVNTATGALIEGNIAYFSSRGPLANGARKPEISAPGVNVISSISSFTTEQYTAESRTFYEGRQYIFAKMSGTSMSSPAVTGVVALILQANPFLSVDEVREILFTTARNDGVTGNIHASGNMSDIWGWGKVDALAAIREALNRLDIEQASSLKLQLTVYPNPTTDQVTLITGTDQAETVSIYASNGACVWNGEVHAMTTLSTASWPKGIYVARASRSAKTAKIVKQ